MRRKVKIFCIKDKIQEYQQDWLDHFQRIPRRQLPKALHKEKETVEGPESVGLTRKPEQVYGLILEDDDDDDEVTSNKHFSTSYKRLLYAKQLPLYLDIPEHLK